MREWEDFLILFLAFLTIGYFLRGERVLVLAATPTPSPPTITNDNPQLAGSTVTFSSNCGPGIIGEIGTVSITHAYTTVTLSRSYENLVVVAQPATENGVDPGVVRIRGVTSNSFEIRFDEWEYLDESHTTETVGYIAMRAGVYEFPDGTKIEAGNFDISNEWIYLRTPSEGAGNPFYTISFSQSFSTAPVVIASVVTENEAEAVALRIRNVGTASFEIIMQEAESPASSNHLTETVSWIAIETGTGTNNGNPYEVGKTADAVTDAWYTVTYTYPQGFSVTPILLASMQTTDGGDTANLRKRNEGPNTFEIHVDEETSRDSETGHTNEVVGYVAFENAGDIVADGSLKLFVCKSSTCTDCNNNIITNCWTNSTGVSSNPSATYDLPSCCSGITAGSNSYYGYCFSVSENAYTAIYGPGTFDCLKEDGCACAADAECYNYCDANDIATCFGCVVCTGGSNARCSNQESDECEAQCGGSSQCDDYSILTCPDSGNICTVECVYTDRDTAQSYCEDSTGCTAYYWNLGGEVAATACCGDDSGENSRTCARAADEPGSDVCTISTDDAACCDAATDCVYNDACYASGYQGDVDGDGYREYCNAGTWDDAPDGSACTYGIECEGTYCVNGVCRSTCNGYDIQPASYETDTAYTTWDHVCADYDNRDDTETYLPGLKAGYPYFKDETNTISGGGWIDYSDNAQVCDYIQTKVGSVTISYVGFYCRGPAGENEDTFGVSNYAATTTGTTEYCVNTNFGSGYGQYYCWPGASDDAGADCCYDIGSDGSQSTSARRSYINVDDIGLTLSAPSGNTSTLIINFDVTHQNAGNTNNIWVKCALNNAAPETETDTQKYCTFTGLGSGKSCSISNPKLNWGSNTIYCYANDTSYGWIDTDAAVSYSFTVEATWDYMEWGTSWTTMDQGIYRYDQSEAQMIYANTTVRNTGDIKLASTEFGFHTEVNNPAVSPAWYGIIPNTGYVYVDVGVGAKVWRNDSRAVNWGCGWWDIITHLYEDVGNDGTWSERDGTTYADRIYVDDVSLANQATPGPNLNLQLNTSFDLSYCSGYTATVEAYVGLNCNPRTDADLCSGAGEYRCTYSGATGSNWCAIALASGVCSGGTNTLYFYARNATYTNTDTDSDVTLTFNPDDAQKYCDACEGSGYWSLGGEVAATACCGDDSGEYKRTRVCTSGCTSDPTDDACCNAADKCVWNGVCYASGAYVCNVDQVIYCNAGSWEARGNRGDTDGDGRREGCYGGQWVEIDITSQSAVYIYDGHPSHYKWWPMYIDHTIHYIDYSTHATIAQVTTPAAVGEGDFRVTYCEDDNLFTGCVPTTIGNRRTCTDGIVKDYGDLEPATATSYRDDDYRDCDTGNPWNIRSRDPYDNGNYLRVYYEDMGWPYGKYQICVNYTTDTGLNALPKCIEVIDEWEDITHNLAGGYQKGTTVSWSGTVTDRYDSSPPQDLFLERRCRNHPWASWHNPSTDPGPSITIRRHGTWDNYWAYMGIFWGISSAQPAGEHPLSVTFTFPENCFLRDRDGTNNYAFYHHNCGWFHDVNGADGTWYCYGGSWTTTACTPDSDCTKFVVTGQYGGTLTIEGGVNAGGDNYDDMRIYIECPNGEALAFGNVSDPYSITTTGNSYLWINQHNFGGTSFSEPLPDSLRSDNYDFTGANDNEYSCSIDTDGFCGRTRIGTQFWDWYETYGATWPWVWIDEIYLDNMGLTGSANTLTPSFDLQYCTRDTRDVQATCELNDDTPDTVGDYCQYTGAPGTGKSCSISNPTCNPDKTNIVYCVAEDPTYPNIHEVTKRSYGPFDPDDATQWCDACEGSNRWIGTPTQGTGGPCCGDDNETFEYSGTDNSACIEGEAVAHGTPSTENPRYLVWDGEILYCTTGEWKTLEASGCAVVPVGRGRVTVFFPPSPYGFASNWYECDRIGDWYCERAAP